MARAFGFDDYADSSVNAAFLVDSAVLDPSLLNESLLDLRAAFLALVVERPRQPADRPREEAHGFAIIATEREGDAVCRVGRSVSADVLRGSGARGPARPTSLLARSPRPSASRKSLRTSMYCRPRY